MQGQVQGHDAVDRNLHRLQAQSRLLLCGRSIVPRLRAQTVPLSTAATGFAGHAQEALGLKTLRHIWCSEAVVPHKHACSMGAWGCTATAAPVVSTRHNAAVARHVRVVKEVACDCSTHSAIYCGWNHRQSSSSKAPSHNHMQARTIVQAYTCAGRKCWTHSVSDGLQLWTMTAHANQLQVQPKQRRLAAA